MIETYEAIREINLLLQVAVAEALARHNLRTDHYNALRILCRNGRMRMGELASQLLLDDSRTTRTVDALEDEGLVERGHDPADRRALLVAITRQGRKREREATTVAERAIANALPWLPDRERAAMNRMLATLRSRMGSP